MRRSGRLCLIGVLVLGLMAGVVLPANAARPPWAGPPEAETVPVVESDPPTFLCDGRVVRFSAGDVTFRFNEMRDGEMGTIHLRDAEATDGRTVYQARGGGHFRFTGEETGRVQINITLVGQGGNVEKVLTTFTVRDGEETVTERGTCSTVFG